jgi:PhnB protein
MKLQPYLNFNGQCEAAFRFYEKVLGGELQAMMTYGESATAADSQPEAHGRILHVRLEVGDAVLMGSDGPPGYDEKPQGIWVNIAVEDVGEAERIFKALADGGTVTMAIAKTFWAERFGMVKDKFGTPWMVNCQTRP